MYIVQFIPKLSSNLNKNQVVIYHLIREAICHLHKDKSDIS